MSRPRDEFCAYWAQWKFARLIVPLKERARELGYNLIVHGSLARDIDVVAVPWVPEAVPAEEFVAELAATIRAQDILIEPDDHRVEGPKEKPHGRRAWSLFVHGTYFDLSVMPRSAP